jgi:hypothetical protein
MMMQPAKGERAGAFSGEAMRGVWRRISLCQAGNGAETAFSPENERFSGKIVDIFHLGLAK